MQVISIQWAVKIPILMEKIQKEKEHRIAVNLLSPFVGVCVDGHHSYIASMMTHKPLRIVTAGLHHSGNNTGAALLDYWVNRFTELRKTFEDSGLYRYVNGVDGNGWDCFYDLMTGKVIGEKKLKAIVDQYPDYLYTV